MTRYEINAHRLWSRLLDMAEIGETVDGGSQRLALSQDDVDGRALFLAWCAHRGYSHVVDRMGNLFLRRAGRDDAAPALVLGSHLDTQPNGGRFDGVLGVLAGLEVLETLDDLGIATQCPVDIAIWTNEEGARFQPAMMGSAAHCDARALPALLAARDDRGVSVAEELARHGYDAGQAVGQHRIARYLELHIEQGPVLEAAGRTIGVVTGGQGIRWFEVVLTGQEVHAGPVPMAARRDPVPALAEVIQLAYRLAQIDADARVTIGRIGVSPGSTNVVPGQAVLSVDLRHPDEAALDQMEGLLTRGIGILDGRGGIRTGLRCLWRSPVVRFDRQTVDGVRAAAARRGYGAMDIVSGAGHDAFNLARIVPTAMIFVPSKGGISHNPAEYTTPEQVAAGANVLLDLVMQFADARTAMRVTEAQMH